MPRSMFSEVCTEETGRSNHGKGSKDEEEESAPRVMGSKSCPHAAECRREKTSRVSIPHHPSRERLVRGEGRGLRHEQEEEGELGAQLVLRKEGSVYVFDLSVKVPSGAAAPTKYTPMEVDAISQVADGRESYVRLHQTNFLMAGGVSVEDKSKRSESAIW